MATQLYILANNSSQDIVLTSTETADDTSPVDAVTVGHTGGKDGNYCNIPDCSASQYFDGHHMLIAPAGANPSWQIALWNNDAQNHLLYYSLDGTFASGQAVQGSSQLKGISILLLASNDIQFFAY